LSGSSSAIVPIRNERSSDKSEHDETDDRPEDWNAKPEQIPSGCIYVMQPPDINDQVDYDKGRQTKDGHN